MNLEIIPGILTDDMLILQKELDLVRDMVHRVQIDIVDGIFATNKTISIEALSDARTVVGLEVHLMVEEPLRYLNRCDLVGVERVYGQVEHMSDQEEFIDAATDLGMEVGLALDVHTPVSALEPMLPYLDGVLVMAVEAGSSGQEFDEGVLAKIEELKEKEFAGDICVDGGLNEDLIGLCHSRGANKFAVTDYLWDAPKPHERLLTLQKIE